MNQRNVDDITLRSTLRDIRIDAARYRATEQRSYLAILVMCPALVAGIYYRIGAWIWYYKGPLAPLMYLLRPVYVCIKRLVEMYTGISISQRALIGSGLYINHFGSIFIGAAIIGENCNLSHEVTIGVAGRGDKKGLPTIGNRVHISPGAKLIGNIVIGDDVAIGANAVVTKSVPDCAVVVGVPAHVISYRGSFDFVLYDAMNTDPERLANLHRSQGDLFSKPPLDSELETYALSYT
jgi:serine O-acetyltransferase